MGRLFLQLNRPELGRGGAGEGTGGSKEDGRGDPRLPLLSRFGLQKERGQNRKALTQLRKVYAEDMRYMDVARELRELEGGEGDMRALCGLIVVFS